jgi:DNA-binding winged helix-turn-helix (wHTH) protein/TolB-like protein/lipoprotein NlpI
MAKQEQRFYEFGPFRLDLAERILLRDGEHVALTPKAYETLLALVENSGRILDKEELLSRVWPDTFIEEATLAKNVSTLRKALGEWDGGREYIETVPKRGYRFAAGVKKSEGEVPALLVRERTRLRVVTEEEDDAGDAQVAVSPAPEPKAISDGGRRMRRRLLWPGLVAAGVALAALAAAAYYRRAAPRGDGQAAGRVQSLAVLPFKFTGADKEDEFLGLGLTDALITKLGYLRQVAVRPTSAVLKYEAEGQDLAAVGRALRVEAVLDGRVQKFGDRLSVRVQLVSARDGAMLWSGEFARQSADLLPLQDALAEQVVRALAVRLTGDERQQLAKRCTENSEACYAYLKGRYLWVRHAADEQIIPHYLRAVEKDPNYALAYAGLSESYQTLSAHSGSSDYKRKAREAAVKAMELDETLAESHLTLGYILMFDDWDWAGAEREFRRAVELNPNSSLMHEGYGALLKLTGRFDEAIAALKRAQELDPLSPQTTRRLAQALVFARQPDLAIEECRKALEMDPEHPGLLTHLAWAYEQKGMCEEALALTKRVKQSSTYPEAISMLGYQYARCGSTDLARRELKELRKMAERGTVPAYFYAPILAGLGEQEEAFACLEKSVAERSELAACIKADVRLESLRSDPRFADLVRRVGLEP